MNKTQAMDMIKATLTRSFDRDRFRLFVLNLVNRMDDSKAFSRNKQYVKDAFKPHVQKFERLGTYTSPDGETVDILIVHLAEASKLERARTAIRNFVADHLRERDEKDAALVAFVSPTEKQWRFSYVKMEYATVEKESGKVGVEARLTPARRFSYLVGEGESCHTAQTRFLSLLQDTSTDPSLADIEDAFSVEAVTKEFFAKYAELFGDINAAIEKLVATDKTLRDEFKAKHVSTVDFAKKLMGQIVFLYFLQKKGWLGVRKDEDWGTGPHDFLRRMAGGEHGIYENFFNDVLEPLFYDTLATDRGHDAWCNRFKCRIPFLNGGLFEPLGDYDWHNVDIKLPNRLFRNDDHVEEGITGTGILDVFDRYNFTVNEAEPLEKEVAIDPEMLGKVFENLIEENRRKGLGAFYTPREIVHYMCQESLINYLDTAVNNRESTPVDANHDQKSASKNIRVHSRSFVVQVPRADIETFVRLGEQISHYESVETTYRIKMPKSIERNARELDNALKDITVCDPAVGSGAFPVGMMTEIVRARAALTPYFNDFGERTPYHFKRHAIQNSLYGVDIDMGAVEIAKLRLWLSLVVDEEDVKQVKPLPNLDYKIVVGNSLLGVEKDLFNHEAFKKLETLKPQFFNETDRERKAQLREQIDAVIHELTHGRETFDYEIYFSEVFHAKQGFDVVIGNPPYVRIQEIKKKNPGFAGLLKSNYASASKGNYDLYVVFVERSMQLLNGCGQFSFILPHKFFNAQYGAPLREVISRGRYLRHVVHYGDQQLFDGATNYVCLLFLAKAGAEAFHYVRVDDVREWLSTYRGTEGMIPATRVSSASWNFTVGSGAGLFEKLQQMSVTLGDIADIFVGLQTSADDVYIMNFVSETRHTITLQSKYMNREWVFERDLLHPIVSGADVEAFGSLPNRQFVLFPYHIENERAELIHFTEISDSWPKTAEYLKQAKDRLEERERGKFKGADWYRFGRSQNLGIQNRTKLCVPRLVEYLHAAADFDGSHYLDNVDVGGLTLHDDTDEHNLAYLLALLNSSVLRWYFPHVSAPFRGGYRSANKQFLSLLPFRPINFADTKEKAQHNAIVRLTESILRTKQQNPADDTTVPEREIDEIVYRLFNLEPDEIALIENALVNTRRGKVATDEEKDDE